MGGGGNAGCVCGRLVCGVEMYGGERDLWRKREELGAVAGEGDTRLLLCGGGCCFPPGGMGGWLNG